MLSRKDQEHLSHQDICQAELDRMNAASEIILRTAPELERQHQAYQEIVREMNTQLVFQRSKCGRSVDACSPYHAALVNAQQAQSRVHLCHTQLHCGKKDLENAKIRLQAVEDSLILNSSYINNGLLEELNTLLVEVMRLTENEKVNHKLLEEATTHHKIAINHVKHLGTKMAKHISTAKPYHDAKLTFEVQIEKAQESIHNLSNTIHLAKTDYRDAMRRLEAISMEIHSSRGVDTSALLQRQRALEHDNYLLRHEPDLPPTVLLETLDRNLSCEVALPMSFHRDIGSVCNAQSLLAIKDRLKLPRSSSVSSSDGTSSCSLSDQCTGSGATSPLGGPTGLESPATIPSGGDVGGVASPARCRNSPHIEPFYNAD